MGEISEAITLTKIGVFNKPCILFNRNGFYKPLRKMFDEIKKVGLLWKESMEHVIFSDDVRKVGDFIEQF